LRSGIRNDNVSGFRYDNRLCKTQ